MSRGRATVPCMSSSALDFPEDFPSSEFPEIETDFLQAAIFMPSGVCGLFIFYISDVVIFTCVEHCFV